MGKPKLVQFRFLQVVGSVVTGDRTTVALIHWDGEVFRSAWSLVNLSPHLEGQITIEDKVQELQKQWVASLGNVPTATHIDQLYPVTEGLGASLQWTTLRHESAIDSEAHFEELVELANLDVGNCRVVQYCKIGLMVHDMYKGAWSE